MGNEGLSRIDDLEEYKDLDKFRPEVDIISTRWITWTDSMFPMYGLWVWRYSVEMAGFPIYGRRGTVFIKEEGRLGITLDGRLKSNLKDYFL